MSLPILLQTRRFGRYVPARADPAGARETFDFATPTRSEMDRFLTAFAGGLVFFSILIF